MLLHRDRIVRAALDRRVVGDDYRLAPLNTPESGHDTRARRFVVVHTVGSQRRKLEERALRVEQSFHSVAHEQFAALDMAAARILRPTLTKLLDQGSKFS